MMTILEKIKSHSLYRKIVNREMISYGIFGGLTTVVNFISYEALYRLGMPNLTANWMAWVIAVSFAYLMNKWFVFRSRSESAKEELYKICKFYGARIVSLGVEQLGMLLLVEKLGIYRWLIKGTLSIVVIIINFLFSKFFIYK